jgi:WhiB family redox-sensing transcriptional regulator
MADISRLPAPSADNYEWQFQGACRGEDPETFFHPEGERGPSRAAREARAKAVCAACPVIAQCAAHALSVREPYGIWGGMSEDDREQIYARQKLSRNIA